MVKVADTDVYGRVALAVLCDGMGGLSCGEVASTAFMKRMENWFMEELPGILSGEQATEQLSREMPINREPLEVTKNQWTMLSEEMNIRIASYGRERGIRLGTTAVSLLVMGNEFLILNIGDSRVYCTTEQQIELLTHDQSYVQQQLDKGKITPQQAEESDQKSVLLQCIGASSSIKPAFVRGKIKKDTVFMLCSDGFWRKQSLQEIRSRTYPKACVSEDEMKKNIIEQIEVLKERGETDNISAVLLSCLQ